MRSQLPRLVSLESFSAALLVTLGVAPQLGCGGSVVKDDGEGGAGGSGVGTSSVVGTTSGPTAVGTGGGGVGTSVGTTGPTTTTVGSVTVGTTTGVGGGGGGCINPEPVRVDGVDTGVDRCAGGQLRRRDAVDCPVPSTPPDETCCGACEEGYICSESGEIACSCIPSCTNDSECDDGTLCLCTSAGGHCVPAGCTTGSDCGPGQECTSWDSSYGCLYTTFACTTAADECGGDLDCSGELWLCSVQDDGVRRCSGGGCAIGRPFLVEGEARTAQLSPRGDWAADAITPLPIEGQAERAHVAAAWALTAAMEHASVAAFARFSLQLMALGAPPELLAGAAQAMADETKHAQLAFALAGAYGGKPLGPGQLALDHALDEAHDVAAILRLVVREGCIGETVAALEAGEAGAHAVDPAIQGVLAVIHKDETAHAELAWRSVSWMLSAFGPIARDVLGEELSRARGELEIAPPAACPEDAALLAHGIATDGVRARLREETLRRVTIPCLEAMLADAAPSETASSSQLTA